MSCAILCAPSQSPRPSVQSARSAGDRPAGGAAPDSDARNSSIVKGAIIIRPRAGARPATRCAMTTHARVLLSCGLLLAAMTGLGAAGDADRDRLVAALVGQTPLADDLEALSDSIGGRPTGSDANRRAVDWA